MCVCNSYEEFAVTDGGGYHASMEEKKEEKQNKKLSLSHFSRVGFSFFSFMFLILYPPRL